MTTERSIYKLCTLLESSWVFFDGSKTCKYLIFSRNYPQRLNPLTEVHAAKTDLCTTDSAWTEEGKNWEMIFLSSTMVQSSLCSMSLAQCLATLEVLNSILLKLVNEWISIHSRFSFKLLKASEPFLLSLSKANIRYCSSIWGTFSLYQ